MHWPEQSKSHTRAPCESPLSGKARARAGPACVLLIADRSCIVAWCRRAETQRSNNMATMISNGLDVVAFLKEQHQQIKSLFSEVRSASGEQRREAFFALRRLLAVHETAEEEIVHPAARK